MLPTLVELCGLDLPREIDFDGRSFRDQLLDPATEVSDRTLFVELQRVYQPKKWQRAVAMTTRWRLVNNTELYDIQADPGQQHNVIDQHPDVVAELRKAFDAYWADVTPGNRDRAVFIAGDERQPELFLHSSDWHRRQPPPWNHAQVAAGRPAVGDWMILPARSGTYQFEVRRWPREADAPLAEAPEIRKSIDAWDAAGPKLDLIYGSEKTNFKKLPVASVRLTVGGESIILPAPEGAREISFKIELEAGRTYEVKAEFLDNNDKVIAGGYYVYSRRID